MAKSAHDQGLQPPDGALNVVEHDVFLGSADWQWPHWPGAFYPADLPPDWRLAYYNTQFSCIWLPEVRWRDTPAAVGEWLADTRADFRFLLEAGEGTDAGAVAAAGFAAGRVLACRADDPRLVWFAAGVDLRDLAQALQRRAAVPGETYLLSRDGDLATLDRVANLLAILNLGPGGRVG